jgi:hypothetical protein
MANATNIQKLIPIYSILGLETVDSKFYPIWLAIDIGRDIKQEA